MIKLILQLISLINNKNKAIIIVINQIFKENMIEPSLWIELIVQLVRLINNNNNKIFSINNSFIYFN